MCKINVLIRNVAKKEKPFRRQSCDSEQHPMGDPTVWHRDGRHSQFFRERQPLLPGRSIGL
jgi:hypothetical protein